MKPAKMGFLLGIFIFCSVTAPVLSGVARLTHNICREYKESCNMDMDPGSCYEVHFRYFYNRTAGECQSFVFTGCNGNLNNYRLKIECDIECNEEYRTEIQLSSASTAANLFDFSLQTKCSIDPHTYLECFFTQANLSSSDLLR
ncbi:kunitz-type protease inhibitor 4 [Microtus ochrogaster]|uniref:Kunitz-type protease inhibitor 4 n=1 Tax=Microtus ochrogaster TaxID=79684 RepID=A0ABM1ASM3_MICOH|nr:kunitz-type protease inhibitor 4 [Microtus ochrogaster]